MYIVDPDALIGYGGGSDPIHFTAFQCIGNEKYLLNCSHEFYNMDYYCDHYRDAGVRCLNGQPTSYKGEVICQ